MSFVYLGTSSFAAAVLQKMVDEGYRPDAVISRPDAPKGRGRVLGPPPVAEKAIEMDLALLQPEEIGANEVLAELDSIDPEALAKIRRERLVRMGRDPAGDYASLAHIREEIEWSRQIFERNRRWPVFNVTNKALEETASEIERSISSKVKGP